MDAQIVVEIVIAAMSGIIAVLFTHLIGELKAVRVSVERLNVQIAVIVEKIESHETRLNKLEEK